MLQNLRFQPKAEANIFAMGLTTIFILGTLALIAVCLICAWLVFQLAVLILSSIVESASLIATTYMAADPLVKFLILLAIGYVLYRLTRKVWRRF